MIDDTVGWVPHPSPNTDRDIELLCDDYPRWWGAVADSHEPIRIYGCEMQEHFFLPRGALEAKQHRRT